MIPIYVISMPSREARIKEHLKERNIDATLFPAFDGKVLMPKGAPYMRDRKPGDEEFFCGPGVLSLVISNLAVMRYCIMNNIPDVVILEDDVELPYDFIAKVETIKQHLPSDYLTLHMEHCCLTSKVRFKPEVQLFTGVCVCCACMMYSLDAMKMITSRARLEAPWDIMLNDIITDTARTYVIDPPIASQQSANGRAVTTLS